MKDTNNMNYKTIETAGQITAVITNKIKLSDLPKIAKSIMSERLEIEQVGYLQGSKFKMMGGELSINGLIAGAFLLKKSGFINNLDFKINKSIVTLALPMSIVSEVNGNIVKLQGITYQLVQGLPNNKRVSKQTKSQLSYLAQGTLASGIIYYENSMIKPLIYVPATNTYIWEKACGSGSLAFSSKTGIQCVVQPSRESIIFKKYKNIITVTETVKEI